MTIALDAVEFTGVIVAKRVTAEVAVSVVTVKVKALIMNSLLLVGCPT